MDKIDLKNLTITQAHNHLVAKDFSVADLTESYLNVIEKENPRINAYLEIYDDVKEQAKKADKIIDEKKSEAPLLTGIPLGIKDNILIKGRKVSCGSKILEGYRGVYDAHIIEELKKQSPIFLGRTNMDEFAMGTSTENSAYGVTKNPHDETRVPGGSSGGSAAAVAMGGALASFGSDTGGSIRQPASFCGVVGLKPTYGTVSRFGLVALASSFDQIGPITKNCEDARSLFKVISKYDKRDSTSIPHNKRIKSDVEKKKVIGVPYHIFEDIKGIDKDVFDNFNTAVKLYETEGYEIRSIKLPHASYALSSYYIILPAEASSNLARFDGVRYGLHKEGDSLIDDYNKTRGEGFGAEVRRRILLGTYTLSAGYYDAYYNKAVAARRLISEDYRKAFESVDVILTPVSPIPAFLLGEKVDDPLSLYLADIFTVSANIAGIPALSVPSGMVARDGKKLPVGLQIIGSHFKEDLLLDMGTLFEKMLVAKT